jgi:hypothetical protein
VKSAEEVFRFLARTTPAVGLMGTIVGLVNMLMSLKNFEQLGPAMAVAQLATFYGLILAYGIWAPFAKRIENYGRNLSVSGAPARARSHQHRRGPLALRPAAARRNGQRRRGVGGGCVSVADSQSPAPPFRDRRAKQPGREPVDLLAYADEDDTSWLLPYVDVISLLLAFLILALAMSKVSLHRFELVSAALSRTAPPPSLDALKEKIDQMIEQQGWSGRSRPVVDDAGLRMELKNALLFDSGQADITPAGRGASSASSSCCRPSTSAIRSRSKATPTTSRFTRPLSTATGTCRRGAPSTC